ncbi:hypothetical protein BWI96_15285 [Siphonobacter sp. SORGH_AS_0500]|uniref:acyltransferase family protein n=1 Tax=Siphonobacter sp. SORGH_AS_0500 TaxID=1864824 RepID=UPI000CC5F84C|nr:acyltransferase [Siphonobacter sp. SORGH_AS_0500]PKK35673.1 hypothetical protein BWI96_15285 [Siphonobacter sp. SORGH_AS_0500]
MQIRKIIPENLVLLDSLRGLTALYVLIAHALLLLTAGDADGFMSMLSSIFQYAHQAVLFFFILSGFVIHWSTDKRFCREKTFDLKAYLLRRIRRIYPPLLAALAFTFLLDQLGLFLKFPIYHSQTAYASINALIQTDHRLQTLLGNLLFVQNVYTPTWGTNGPLWSLTYEWWFYILYIPVYGLFRKNKSFTSAFILVLWILNREFPFKPALFTIVFDYFIIWYLGVLLADYLRSKDLKTPFVVSYVIILFTLSLTRYSGSVGSDLLISLGIILFLYLVLCSNAFIGLGKARKLGDFSYTLYLIHVPILCFLSGVVMHARQGYLPANGLYVTAGILFCLSMAWLFHFISEKPFTARRV